MFEPGDDDNSFLMADTGHKGDLPSEGTLMILTLSLFCSVFDHFTIMCMPGAANIKSALDKCFKWSYATME